MKGRSDDVVDARIVFWGMPGAGKSTNLATIHSKLRPDHRGRLETIPTRLDPTVGYEVLPIELGEIAGVRTRIHVVAVPGGAEHASTRKQLLDEVDGVVLVVDSRRDCIDDNLASFEELRAALTAYGKRLDELPLVIQYNKQDLSDPFAMEELHRKLEVKGAAVFESVASEGTGVLQTLSTISKRVVRTLRGSAPPPAPEPQTAPRLDTPTRPLPQTPEAGADTDEDALIARAQAILDPSWPADESGEGWRLLSAGTPVVEGASTLALPLVLADPEGRELRLRLTVSLDSESGD